MRLSVATVVDRLRVSLFVVPMLGVVTGVGLAEGMLAVDRSLGIGNDLPLVLTSTVEGARSVLSTVATATISVAGIAFSVSLLILQQASGQFSPRVVHGLFRDPFNRRVMAVALGTFSYSLVVLRAVRAPEESGAAVVVPNLSVALAVLLGIGAILAIIGLISHIAHTMEVSAILRRILTEARGAVPEHPGAATAVPDAPAGGGHLVRADRDGWVQQIAADDLLGLVGPGGMVRMETGIGRFVFGGAPLLSVWPAPPHGGDGDDLAHRARDAVVVGASRTVAQDPTYGIRQLVDVALIALSSGVNDATTAQDALFHAGALLTRLLAHPQRRVHRDDDGRTVVLAHTPTPVELVELTFTEVRQAAAPLPDVCVYVLECLHLVRRTLEGAPVDPAVAAALDAQAHLVLAGAEQAGPLPADLARVRRAHDRHFA